MRILLALLAVLLSFTGAQAAEFSGGLATNAAKKVYILPIREAIMPSMVYMVRRGVKEAMEAKADLLVVDLDTPGGRGDSMMEIIEIIENFPRETVAFVNPKAFSAGALMSFAASKIYMAPQSVIGAAAPVMASQDGGVQAMPDTMEIKSASAISAEIRGRAEKNRHNVELVDAMMKKSTELVIDGHTIKKKDDLLTLTNTEAEKEYGNPPKRLLSSGTVKDLDTLIAQLGYAGATQHRVNPTGMEKIGSWLNMISPLLLIIGIAGIYVEFKTPGFGLPGIVGITAFALYFLGGYVAGLSGAEWVVVFVLGLALVFVELFVYPGTVMIGLLGATLMLAAIVMAMVDLYPATTPGFLPAMPTFDKFDLPMQNLIIATFGGGLAIWLASLILPKTSLYRAVISQSASGMQTEARMEAQKKSRHGQIGVTTSVLRPGGKAKFGEEILDVVSQGDMLPKGTSVRIVGSSGSESIVEAMKEP